MQSQEMMTQMAQERERERKKRETDRKKRETDRKKREKDVGIICVIIYDDLALEAWTQREREREREL